MNNFKKITAAALAISFSFLGASVVGESNVSFASENKVAPKVNLDIEPSNAPYQESVVTLNQNDATRQAVLNQLREVRSKAWDENLEIQWGYDSRKVRDIYYEWNEEDSNDKEGYVNAYSYSLGLEQLALQRAYELSLTGSSQERPDGSRYEMLNYKGLTLVGSHYWIYNDYEDDISPELLFDTLLYNKDIEGGNGYEKFKKSNGSYAYEATETTHSAFDMLRYGPAMGVGYGQVKNPETGKNFAVIAFDLDPFYYDEPKKVDYVGDYTMSFGNPNFKKPSKESLDRLEASVKKAKQTIAGAEVLTKSMPNFAEKNSSALNRLIENQRIIISKAEAILRANGR